MDTKLKLLARVIAARIEKGEDFDGVLRDYPRLSPQEETALRDFLGV